MKKRREESTPDLRAFMRDYVPVWNKQCVRCATVFSKFHRLCPECSYGEWLLEGEVVDVESSRGRRQAGRYRPKEETIAKVKAEIQADWEKKGDVRATQGRVSWDPPTSRIQDRGDDFNWLV